MVNTDTHQDWEVWAVGDYQPGLDIPFVYE